MIFDMTEQVNGLLKEWESDRELLEKLSPDTEKYRIVRTEMGELELQIERWIRLGRDLMEDERRFELQKKHEENEYRIQMAKVEAEASAAKRQTGLSMLSIGSILTEVLLVLNFEKFDVLTSKAIGMIPKIGAGLKLL